LVLERFPNSAIVLRPGLIVGKWDPTGRFTYWCERLLRGGAYLAPLPRERPVQLIDAADIARFAERAIAGDLFGTFNTVGPQSTTTMREVLEACARVAAERNAPAGRAVWVGAQFLDRNEVQEWIEMPLWLQDPAYAGILQVSNAAAVRTGFEYRPLEETIRAILDWAAESPDHRVAGLSSEREATLLQSAELSVDGEPVDFR
jgi:2'-hydroxyisoflavone reductase